MLLTMLIVGAGLSADSLFRISGGGISECLIGDCLMKKGKILLTATSTLAAAAITGLFVASAYADEHAAGGDKAAATAGHDAGAPAATGDTAGKHDCKGKNECKGKGGCKSSDNGCKGKNSCKGKGGCSGQHE